MGDSETPPGFSEILRSRRKLFGFLAAKHIKPKNIFVFMVLPDSDDIEKIKQKLRTYDKSDLYFNEPHFTKRFMERCEDRGVVIGNLLNPEKLAYFDQHVGKYGDWVHDLYFDVGNRMTLILPVIFDEGGKKCLYIITYILRPRPWQGMVKKNLNGG
jgi:hypothetical protein